MKFILTALFLLFSLYPTYGENIDSDTLTISATSTMATLDVTICAGKSNVLITQFNSNGDILGMNSAFIHQEGKRVHTIRKKNDVKWFRVNIDNECYIFEVVEKIGGPCLMIRHYTIPK